jgi:hypothetical protein
MSQEQIDFDNMLVRDILQQPRRWVDVVRYGTWSRPHDLWDQDLWDQEEHYDSNADEDRPTEPWEEPVDEEW